MLDEATSRHLTWWHVCWPCRSLNRWLIRRGVGYVRFDGDDERFWTTAMRHAPIRYRWFQFSLTLEEVDKELRDFDEWLVVREKYVSGDKIWPFVINYDTMAMRLGYVLVRKGVPLGGVVTAVS